MKDIRKIIGTIIGILGFIASLAGLTYAMQTFSATNNNTVTGGHACEPIVSYAKGQDITLNNDTGLKETTDYKTSNANTTLTFYAAPDCGTSKGTIYININTIGSSYVSTSAASTNLFQKLRYTIVKNTTTPQTYTGSITQSGQTAVDVGILERTATTYTVYIWVEELSGTSDTPDPDITFTGYISASARQTSSFDK